MARVRKPGLPAPKQELAASLADQQQTVIEIDPVRRVRDMLDGKPYVASPNGVAPPQEYFLTRKEYHDYLRKLVDKAVPNLRAATVEHRVDDGMREMILQGRRRAGHDVIDAEFEEVTREPTAPCSDTPEPALEPAQTLDARAALLAELEDIGLDVNTLSDDAIDAMLADAIDVQSTPQSAQCAYSGANGASHEPAQRDVDASVEVIESESTSVTHASAVEDGGPVFCAPAGGTPSTPPGRPAPQGTPKNCSPNMEAGAENSEPGSTSGDNFKNQLLRKIRRRL